MNLESRFTKPRADCPHPEYWTSQDSDSTENEVLEMLHGLIRGLQPDFVIETGSAHGYGTKALGSALLANGHGRLVSLEVDPKRAQEASERASGLPVTVLNQRSLDYTPEETIDFAFFDSLFELRAKEFKAYYPHMTPNTVVAFHDTSKHHSLWPEIDKLEEDGYIKGIYLPTPRGITIAQVIK